MGRAIGKAPGVIALALAVLASGCAYFEGYRSKAVPEVTVIRQKDVERIETEPESVTVVVPSEKGWSAALQRLFERARARGRRYVGGMRAEWTFRTGETLVACTVGVEPVRLSYHSDYRFYPRTVDLQDGWTDGWAVYQVGDRAVYADPSAKVREGNQESQDAFTVTGLPIDLGYVHEKPGYWSADGGQAMVEDIRHLWVLFPSKPACRRAESERHAELTLRARVY